MACCNGGCTARRPDGCGSVTGCIKNISSSFSPIRVSRLTTTPGCKFQSENVPEYKKKTGKNQGEKCTTAPSGLSASTLSLVISLSFADQLPQSSSLTRGELPGTRLLSNLV